MSGSKFQNEQANSYLSGGSMAYVDALYEDYLADPHSVSEDWQAAFNALPQTKGQSPEVSHREIRDYFLQNADKKSFHVAKSDEKQANVDALIESFRRLGHLAAKLDPLEMAVRPPVPSLELAFHHLTDKELDKEFINLC
jgi:2-oxoglutarate dehydrogenase E1 component